MVTLPGITIQAKIYESSNSLVYRGTREDGLPIIAKLLKQEYPSAQEIARYRQEYDITRSLNLPGVVRAYGQQTYQRTPAILLEDFGGESLEQWRQQRPDVYPMPLPLFLSLAVNLVDSLGSIHNATIIHKDINPSNIVFNSDTGVVKIIDFGIATRFNRTNPTFKSPHGLEGTLAYLSPEQTGRMNRAIDYRTDFYSLGVTFYELLTGQLPFLTTDILELVHCHIAKSPIPPQDLNAAIPEAVAAIILKLMAKNAEDRYQSAWGIKADLEDCAEQLKTRGQINAFPLGRQEVADQLQIPQKLYGREEEIAALVAAFERVAGRSASPDLTSDLEDSAQTLSPTTQPSKLEIMLVSGPAGVGKSALVQELYKAITARRGYFIAGKFDQLQRNAPYSAIADALRNLVQHLLGEPDQQVQKWRSQLLAGLGSNGQLIIDVIPEVELIIGKQSLAPEVGPTEAQNRFNQVFQQFIRVFCSDGHPLVVFLDDLQWIDSATIQLIELMRLDEQTQSLFLIGAYRNNEVSPTHPLALMLERLRTQGTILQEIILEPLTLMPLTQLIAETIHQDVNTAHTLTELVRHKTEGNPFFVGEFLQFLYSENLLSFDADDLNWQWSLAQIQAHNVTNNVVELLLIKLKKLPEVTQQLLQLAACIGAEFDLETLAIACERSPKTVFQDLLIAIQSGFIQPVSELSEDLLVQDYKFLHDRVQQAAYALIDGLQKQIAHLQIGRNLFKKMLSERLSERLFEIVDHLNHGIELVTDQTERDEIAQLNLRAAQKAKGAIAYSVAQTYLTSARSWLPTSSWQTNYDLTLSIYLETTEVAYLCGEEVESLFYLPEITESAQAVENAALVESYLIRLTGTPLQPLYYFYDALARLAIYSESSAQVQDQILERVAVSLAKMKQWAYDAPMNHLHKYHLVEAEKARVLGQLLEAEEFYEQAIQGARDHEYLQEEALAYELAAKFYLSRGREKFAQTYMKEAHYCYERWGAMAKRKDLETRYPQFFAQASGQLEVPIFDPSRTTSNHLDDTFDLAAVLKASQAISSEIELDQLLHSLMQILIETAGAQTGCLLLENSGEWVIEAACELNDGGKVCAIQVLQSISVANHLPESVIQYVIRTQESVILNDAAHEGNFVDDPYIQHHQTQSLLCLPLLNQSKLVGVLYLENQLTAGAFTPDRSQVLNLLSTQAAIAIANAKLYSRLRASESQMAQFLEAIPVGIAILDATGHPYYVNQQGIELLGKGVDPAATPEQLSEVYQLYVTGTDQIYPSERLPIIRALSGERTRTDDADIHQNNAIIPAEAWGTPVFDEQGNVVYAIAAFQDITERKQAEHLLANYNRTLEQEVAERTAALQQSEAELRAREQELRLITDALPVGIGYIDAEQRHRFVNHTYEIWRNCSRDEILGKSIRELVDHTSYQVLEPYVNQALAGQTTTFEAEILLPTGKKYLSTTLIPDFNVNAQVIGFYALNTDIGDRKRAEAASILEERNRMAREIHDTLAQSFTGILVQISAATQVLTDDLQATQTHLEIIDELARTGLAEARRSVVALRPQLLEEGDLSSALHRLVTQMRATADTALIYDVYGTAYPLPTEIENHLLRIGQEALTNAVKYASAREIRIELRYEDGQCRLRIQDDGIGFRMDSLPAEGGFGLLGMSERAEQMGAQLTIQSQPGQGTEIVVVFSQERAS
ncbi:AAA family ATPase [Nodosilinea sp. AN01ver1]|uniref:AAA family ATPase n=1 Tax=Nodosilinea sp. AN01ver1 TaxID=3423362 RepID=UPI003D316F60